MTSHAQLASQLRSLKLSGILQQLDVRLLEAQQNKLSYSEFLTMIVTDELETRQARKLARLLSKAMLGSDQTLETFDFNFSPSVNAAQIRELASCNYLSAGEGIILLGPTGTGKTHLAKALAHQACRSYCSVAFYNFQKLFSDLAQADLSNRLPALIKKITTVDLLLIDDFAFTAIDQHASELLYTIVDSRYGKRSIILTSNRAITDWSSIFPDPVIANAILDRLAHRAHHIVLKGESYRKKYAPQTLSP